MISVHDLFELGPNDALLRQNLTNIGTGAGKAIGAGVNLLGQGVNKVAQLAQDNPLATAGVAAGAGLMALMRRRRM